MCWNIVVIDMSKGIFFKDKSMLMGWLTHEVIYHDYSLIYVQMLANLHYILNLFLVPIIIDLILVTPHLILVSILKIIQGKLQLLSFT